MCTLKILNGQELEEYLEANAERIQDYTSLNDPIVNTAVAEAYYNRGLIYLRMGKTRQGIQDLSKAGELGLAVAYSVLKRANSD